MSRQSERPPAATEGKRLILAGIVAFVLAFVVLLALAPRFRPAAAVQERRRVTEAAVAAPDGSFEATIDVSPRDRWIGFDFGAGRLTAAGEAPDILAMRHFLRAPAGAADLGAVALSEARSDAVAGWTQDEDVRGVVQNPALARWYRYSYWTHALDPSGHVYAVRRASGGVALFTIVSYYCEPEGSGCLTLRYRLE